MFTRSVRELPLSHIDTMVLLTTGQANVFREEYTTQVDDF